MRILIETIGNHNCTGYTEGLPPLVQRFGAESGAEVEHRTYRAWDLGEDAPGYVREKLAEIRAGRAYSAGFFVNGRWLPTSPHNAEESAAARQALAEAAGVPPGPADVAWHAHTYARLALEASTANTLFLGDNSVAELGAFCNQFERVWFFDGAIKKLSVDCPVEQFHHAGYDVRKLVEIANRHPELFQEARLGTGRPGGGKAAIEEITVRLLAAEDLQKGAHPCVITGGQVAPGHALHLAAAERFGGWGYVAEHAGKACGFLGILPKDLAQRDAQGFLPPCAGNPPEQTLLLTCLAGGGVFGPAYHHIGVATALVQRAVADAAARGYRCVEGNPTDPGIGSLLARCGFVRVDWPACGNSPLREQAFYRLNLTAQGKETTKA
jgi:hypothetical protein